MTIAGILKVLLFIFAGVCLLAAFRMLLIGMRSRNSANSQFFNVGRLEAQRKVLRSLLSTVGFVVLALVFLVAAISVPDEFLSGWLAPSEDDQLAEIENNSEEGEAGSFGEVVGSDLGEGESEVAAQFTPTPIPTNTPEPTPVRNYIYVDSPIVGLYIRDLPDGDIIDVLEDRSRLSLGGESTIVNGINWILVFTDDEREGWVAEQFTTTILPRSAEPTPES